MKNILILLGLFVFLVIEKASGVPFFDPFADATPNGGSSYAVGANLIGQSNKTLFLPWYSRGTVTGSSVQPTNVAGTLSYAGLPSSTGNSVAFVGAVAQDACLDLNVAVGHTATVYASFLLKVTDITAVPTSAANNPFAAFIDDPTPSANNIQRL